MLPLIQFEKNVTSQNGEDGVLSEIFRRLGEKKKHCVEFGAWDGKFLSNTWSLWAEHGWKALLIEGCPEKFKVLQDGTRGALAGRHFLGQKRNFGTHLGQHARIELLEADFRHHRRLGAIDRRHHAQQAAAKPHAWFGLATRARSAMPSRRSITFSDGARLLFAAQGDDCAEREQCREQRQWLRIQSAAAAARLSRAH